MSECVLGARYDGGARKPLEKEGDVNKKAVVVIFLIIIGFAIVFPSYLNADPLDNWYLRKDLSPDVLESVAYGNGLFVGIGGNDVWTSPNGVAWTKRTSGTNNYQVAYGNSIFVAVGSPGAIITSPDGITWTPQISRTTNALRGVAFGNGFFMAVGYGAPVVTSPDGTTWTQRTLDKTWNPTKLRYLNNLFVTIDYWSATILSSSDGIAWNESHITQAAWVPNDVAYGNNTYVVVGGRGEIFTSPDLVSWTERTNTGVTENSLYSVICTNDLFVAVGYSGTIITSPDGITWTVRTSPTSDSLNDVTFGRGTLVAVGYDVIQSDPIIDIPHIYVNPTAINFGNIIIGDTSDRQVTVRNDGNANLIIGTITSPSPPFNKITDNCSGQTLAPGASCTSTYRFSPTSEKTFSDYSNIPSNDPDNNQVTVSLDGVGAVLETISIPNILRGPIEGTTGVSYPYATGGSTSNFGHTVEYQFDWKGDGSDLSAWGSSTQSKTWTLVGTYSVKARARCKTDTLIESGWSSALSVKISGETVSTPSVPIGSGRWITGVSCNYSTGGATSNLGHTVECQFDWKGDGSGLSSWGSSTQSNTWKSAGTYYVRARARCAAHTDVISSWSGFLSVNISPDTISYIVTTNPPGLQITVDGSTYTAPQTFNWVPDSPHTISVAYRQFGTSGTQYLLFSSWSDGGASKHDITAPSYRTINTANFTIQYSLTTSVSPPGAGTISPSGTNWYKSNQVIPISATANNGYTFSRWVGDLYGTANSTTITMKHNMTLTAYFQTMGPDLTGSWTKLNQTCKTTSKGRKCTIKGTLNVRNDGNGDVLSSFLVAFYLSYNENGVHLGDHLTDLSVAKIMTKKGKAINFIYNLPLGRTAKGQYIKVLIDANDNVPEINKTNNIIVSGPIQ
jgi:hypothetical protein